MRPTPAILALMLGVTLAPALSGCHENLCEDDEYPVYMRGTLDTSQPGQSNPPGAGQMCVKKGSPVPSGYASYAPGHTPTIG